MLMRVLSLLSFASSMEQAARVSPLHPNSPRDYIHHHHLAAFKRERDDPTQLQVAGEHTGDGNFLDLARFRCRESRLVMIASEGSTLPPEPFPLLTPTPRFFPLSSTSNGGGIPASTGAPRKHRVTGLQFGRLNYGDWVNRWHWLSGWRRGS